MLPTAPANLVIVAFLAAGKQLPIMHETTRYQRSFIFNSGSKITLMNNGIIKWQWLATNNTLIQPNDYALLYSIGSKPAEVPETC